MRDALSLLDQCIAFFLGQKLTYEHVLEVLGAVDTEVFSRLLRAVMQADTVTSIAILEEMVIQGRDLGQFVTDFTWYLRNLLLIQSAPDMEEILDMSRENLELLKEEAEMIDAEVLMRYIRVLSDLSGQMKYAAQKRVLIEIALIKLCRPAMETSQDALIDRISQLEKRIESGVVMTVSGGNIPQNVMTGEKTAGGKSVPGKTGNAGCASGRDPASDRKLEYDAVGITSEIPGGPDPGKILESGDEGNWFRCRRSSRRSGKRYGQ